MKLIEYIQISVIPEVSRLSYDDKIFGSTDRRKNLIRMNKNKHTIKFMWAIMFLIRIYNNLHFITEIISCYFCFVTKCQIMNIYLLHLLLNAP